MRPNQKYATRFPHRAGIYLGAEAALLVVASILPLIGAARDAIRLTTCDSLDTAREWIEANVPAGSRIGVECFAPWVDRQKFSVQSFYKLNDQPPEWYIVETKVFTDGGYEVQVCRLP